MPPKPTCKVVKREGQRGARIDPKGCKVRTTKDAQGNKRQYNKQGQEKFKITEIRNEHAVTIAGSRQYATVVRHWKTTTGPNAMSVAQKGAFKRNHKMIYDTGATMTTMSRSMLRKIGENPNRTNNVRYTTSQGAIGPVVQTKVLNDVVFYVLIHSSGQHVHTGPLPQEWVKIKVDVAVMDSDQANLLGTTTIKQLKSCNAAHRDWSDGL